MNETLLPSKVLERVAEGSISMADLDKCQYLVAVGNNGNDFYLGYAGHDQTPMRIDTVDGNQYNRMYSIGLLLSKYSRIYVCSSGKGQTFDAVHSVLKVVDRIRMNNERVKIPNNVN